MNKIQSILLSAVIASLGINAQAADEPAFKWPHGAKAAVNLAYDDALDSQLENVVPTLNKYHLKGTFYIPVGAATISPRMEDWRKVAKAGHELGNHSIFHQCSKGQPGRDWVTEDHDLDKVSVIQMQDQVKVANSFLKALDGKTERTYTPPCIDFNAGGKNYIDGLKSEFVAIKGGFVGVTADMKTLDPYAVGVDFPADETADRLIALVKEAAEKGTMVNFTFHGVGGDHLVTSVKAHEELVKYLAEHKDIYWTDTFINIMKYVKTEQAKTAMK
jgi:peptidoglycan/xylan/chitin deacetylase (PgdA/CDA1 family)